MINTINSNFYSRMISNYIKKIEESNQRISSGLKLTKDLSSYLPKLNKFKANLSALKYAQNNIQEGISYLQYRENVYKTLSYHIQDLNTLSIAYKNNLISEEEKNIIENNAREIINNIKNIVDKSFFNGKNIFEMNDIYIQTGTVKDEGITIKNSVVKNDIDTLINMDVKDFLNSDFAENPLLKNIAHDININATYENLLEHRMNLNLSLSSVYEDYINKIESVDIAKEMLEKTKNETMLSSVLTLMGQQLDNQRNYIFTLLR